MKKTFAAIAAALAIAVCTLTAASAVYAEEKGQVAESGEVFYANVQSYLSLRAGASSSTAELYRLPPGTKVYVKGWSGDWGYAYVPSVDDYGFLYSGYLSRSNPVEPTGTAYYANVQTFLSLRAEATSSSRELRRLDPGTKVLEQSRTGNWSYVYVPDFGEYGYVYNGYLSSSNPVGGSVYYANVKTFLSLRASASSSSTELCRLNPATELRVKSWDGSWAYVYVPDKDSYGYVYSGYISKTKPYIPEGTMYYADVITFLSVREGPASDTTELHKLGRGARVKVLEWEDNNWAYAYIPATDDYGYVYAKYLTRNKPQ